MRDASQETYQADTAISNRCDDFESRLSRTSSLCEEVVAVSKILEERFRQSLPEQYTTRGFNTWPTQSPGNRFCEAFGCWIDVHMKNPRKYFGCATYLFDLGGGRTHGPIAQDRAGPCARRLFRLVELGSSSQAATTLD
jgi:hypothetical protein